MKVRQAFIKPLNFSHPLTTDCCRNIYLLSPPKHNRVFMKVICTRMNRNDIDLTVIYFYRGSQTPMGVPSLYRICLMCVQQRDGGRVSSHISRYAFEIC